MLRTALLTGVLAVALAAPAQGATKIGDTFVPDTANPCPTSLTGIQTTAAGFISQAPTPGVITSWQYHASATAVPQLKFKVFRRTTEPNFTTIAQSSVQTPTPGVLNTFTLSPGIPVQTGDFIGATYVTQGACYGSAAGLHFKFTTDDTAVGSTDTYGQLDPARLDIAASLEADYDSDGLGDETQDADDDGDGFADGSDACPVGVIGASNDPDADGCKNTEDADDDNDTIADGSDDCPTGVTGPGSDPDGDGCKNSEDLDDDDDTVVDTSDNCSLVVNPDQANTDGDTDGDACDADDDNDTVADSADGCRVQVGPAANGGCPQGTYAKCQQARDNLAAAKKKLKRLKRQDASQSAIAKAKKKVKKTKAAVTAACAA